MYPAMSVESLGGNRYRVKVYAGRRDGRDRQLSHTFTASSRKEAQRIGQEHETRLQQRATAERTDSIATITQAWYAKQQADSSPTTLRSYKRIVERILAEFGPTPVAELTAEQVEEWETRLTATLSPATVNKHHAVLSAILRRAERANMINGRVTTKITRPRQTRPGHDLPRDTMMRRLLTSATGDLAIAVRLAASTGLRRGELLGLRWTDLERRTLHARRVIIETDNGHQVRDTLKGKRSRVVPLDYGTLRILAAHRQDRREGYILSPDGVEPYSPSWLSKSWADHCRTHQIRCRLHDLRHWYATTVLQSGQVTIYDLSQILGHAKPSITNDIYIHGNPVAARTAAKVIGAALR